MPNEKGKTKKLRISWEYLQMQKKHANFVKNIRNH